MELDRPLTAEEVFKNWLFRDEKGTYWPDTENMPPGVAQAIGNYSHTVSNKSPEHPEAVLAAARFKELTGFSAADFVALQIKLSRRE